MSTEGRSPIQEQDYLLERQVGHLLRRAYQRACANLVARIGCYDLTPMQLAALMRLKEIGSASQNRLGRLIAMEPANIHGLVGRLLKRGLVTTERDPTDRRLVMLSLSREGEKLIEEVIPLHRESTAETLGPLNAAERETLVDLLRRMS